MSCFSCPELKVQNVILNFIFLKETLSHDRPTTKFQFIVHIRLIFSQCSAIVPPYYIFICTILRYSLPEMPLRYTSLCCSVEVEHLSSFSRGHFVSRRVRAFKDEAVIVTVMMAWPSDPILLYFLSAVQWPRIVLCFSTTRLDTDDYSWGINMMWLFLSRSTSLIVHFVHF